MVKDNKELVGRIFKDVTDNDIIQVYGLYANSLMKVNILHKYSEQDYHSVHIKAFNDGRMVDITNYYDKPLYRLLTGNSNG